MQYFIPPQCTGMLPPSWPLTKLFPSLLAHTHSCQRNVPVDCCGTTTSKKGSHQRWTSKWDFAHVDEFCPFHFCLVCTSSFLLLLLPRPFLSEPPPFDDVDRDVALIALPSLKKFLLLLFLLLFLPKRPIVYYVVQSKRDQLGRV